MKTNSNLKQQVKEKASDLFFKHGPKNVSMEEIAEGSGISKKTLYQLFHNKHTIVQEVVDDLVQSHDQLFETSHRNANDAIDEVLKQDTGLTSICKSLRPGFFYELEKYFPDIWTHLEEYKSKVHRGIEDNLRKGKEEGLYSEDLNFTFISDLRLQQLVNLLRPDILTNLSLNANELVGEFTFLYLRAISTEKGRKQLHKYIEERS